MTASTVVRLDTAITKELETALHHMVTLSGMSKATIVREALSMYLVAVGGALPSVIEASTRQATAGPGLAPNRKAKK